LFDVSNAPSEALVVDDDESSAMLSCLGDSVDARADSIVGGI
jgi:hypothetical protein